jgi:hypothetical protein
MNIKALLNKAIALIIFTSLSGTSQAALISDIDLTTFDFDVTSVVGTNPLMTAAGTSNGIGWGITPTNYWMSRTVTNATFNFSSLPILTDNLHPSGYYTITFDKTVSSLLVAVSNDNTTDSINFGLTASDFSDVTFSGTQVVLNNTAGGLILFESINSLSIQNINDNGISDGYDLAFHVVSTVPVPAAVWLFGCGLLSLIGFARRKTEKSLT